MAAKYDLVSEFKGYVTKPDVTNTDQRYLTKGSFNVVVNDEEKVTGRLGYSTFGTANTDRNPIQSAFTWNTSSSTELLLRGANTELQLYWDGSWVTLADGFTTSQFGFPRSSKSGWWNSSEGLDTLPFVAKDANIYTWNGAVEEVSATTSNTITLTNNATWAEARFDLTTGTVVINGTEYAYTGGTDTDTLTGVTPDPTGEANGSVVTQKVVTLPNKPGSGLTNDIIDILNNQLIVGDFTSREVYIGANDDLDDFSSISTPRQPGEAALLTLDNTPTAFVIQESTAYISAGKSDWYEVIFDLQNSGSTFIENISINKLKNAPQQACQEKDLVANIKNSVVFISHEPALEELGRVENINTPQSRPLSDAIKPDFDSYNFAGGDIIYWKNQVLITVPEESLLLIYDLENGWWQPPMNLPFGKLSVYQNKLIAHSKVQEESYELFGNGQTSDNGNIIDMQAVFAYRNFGDRALLKEFDEYYTEGYISANTNLTLTLDYDFEGDTSTISFEIKGNDESITSGRALSGGLGSLPLGQATLGSSSETPTDIKKFRQVNGLRPTDFYELRVTYSTTDDDAQFELLAHGPQIRYSPNQNNHITK